VRPGNYLVAVQEVAFLGEPGPYRGPGLALARPGRDAGHALRQLEDLLVPVPVEVEPDHQRVGVEVVRPQAQGLFETLHGFLFEAVLGEHLGLGDQLVALGRRGLLHLPVGEDRKLQRVSPDGLGLHVQDEGLLLHLRLCLCLCDTLQLEGELLELERRAERDLLFGLLRLPRPAGAMPRSEIGRRPHLAGRRGRFFAQKLA
jgi:hypothetical protein